MVKAGLFNVLESSENVQDDDALIKLTILV